MPAVGFALFLSFSCTCFFPAVGKCSFHPLWVRSSSFFSLASSNLAMFAQTVGFSWSCVRSTASLRLRTLFHVLRVDWWSPSTTHSPPPRAARVEGVSPELVCSGSSLLSKQLQHCLSPRVFTSPDETTSWSPELFRFSALSAPLCGSLQRRTRGLPVWHLRHHCVVVGSR